MNENYIREHYKRMGYNVSKTARSLDLDYQQTKDLLEPQVEKVSGPTEPRPADIRELGKPHLRRYVIAIKATRDGEWGEEFASVINTARVAYDLGTHEMFQETRGGWNILYCQRRKTPTAPRTWFSS